MTDFISSLTTVMNAFKENGFGIIEELGTGLGRASDVLGVNAIDTIQDSIEITKNGVTTATGAITDAADMVWSQIGIQKQALQKLIEDFVSMLNDIASTIADKIGELTSTVGQIIANIKEAMVSVISQIGDLVVSIKDGLVDTVMTIVGTIKSTFTTVAQELMTIGDSVASILQEVYSAVETIVLTVVDTIRDLGEFLVETVKAAILAIRDLGSTIVDGLMALFALVKESMESLLKDVIKAGEIISSVAVELSSAAKEITEMEGYRYIAGVGILASAIGTSMIIGFLVVRYLKD